VGGRFADPLHESDVSAESKAVMDDVEKARLQARWDTFVDEPPAWREAVEACRWASHNPSDNIREIGTTLCPQHATIADPGPRPAWSHGSEVVNDKMGIPVKIALLLVPCVASFYF
jgi:hypothetical protein